jgi:hypothetical protein
MNIYAIWLKKFQELKRWIRENEILSFLVPKLMIITGQATENNFN